MKLTFSLIFLLLLGCSGDKNSQFKYEKDININIDMRTMMLGEWCGEKILDNGTYQKWVINRFEDGIYKIEFTQIRTNGAESECGEYGLWGIRNPIYFSAMRGFITNGQQRPADTTKSSFYDAYEIVLLTESEFTYKSFKSGNTFTINRQCGKRQT